MLGAFENGNGPQVDKLTGLPTRVLFDQELAKCVEERPGGFGVIYADADDLKNTNDTYGHSAGDELLADIASALQETFRHETKREERELDYVGRGVFRMADKGDEFGIIIAGADTQEKVDAARDRAQNELAKKGIRLSMGGRPHRKGESAEELLHDVDEMARDNKLERLPELSDDQQTDLVLAAQHLARANVQPRDVPKYIQKYGGSIALENFLESRQPNQEDS